MSNPTAGSCTECPVDLTTDDDPQWAEGEVPGVPVDLTTTDDDDPAEGAEGAEGEVDGVPVCCICLSTVGQIERLGCCRGCCHPGCYQRWEEAVRLREDYVEGVSCPQCRAIRIE